MSRRPAQSIAGRHASTLRPERKEEGEGPCCCRSQARSLENRRGAYDTVRWLGVGLFAVGGGLRLWPMFVLGRLSGYSVIRHPSYLCLLVNSLGWGLAFRSGVGVLLAAVLVPMLLARIRAEEKLLHTQFGNEYDAYRSRTSRLIPGLY